MGQRRQNTGRRRWYGYVGQRTIQSQTNEVDAAGHRRRADSHLPGTTVPGRLDIGTLYGICTSVFVCFL